MEWEDLPKEIQNLYITEVNTAQKTNVELSIIIERFNKTGGFGNKKQGLFDWDKSTDCTSFWNSIIEYRNLKPYYKKYGNKNEKDWFDKHFTEEEKEDILKRIKANIIRAGNKTDLIPKMYYDGWFLTEGENGFNFKDSIEGEAFWKCIAFKKDYKDALYYEQEKEWIDRYFNNEEKESILNYCEKNVIKVGNKWTDSLQQKYCKGCFPAKEYGGFTFNESIEGPDFWKTVAFKGNYKKAIEILNNNSQPNTQHVERTSSTGTESTKYVISFGEDVQIERYSPTGRPQIPGGGCQAEMAGCNEQHTPFYCTSSENA